MCKDMREKRESVWREERVVGKGVREKRESVW